MAKEAPKSDQPAAAPASAGEAKKGLPIKTIIVVIVMLVVEAGAVIGLMSMLGKPSPVKGVEVHEDPHAEEERLVEIPVVAEKYTNNSAGRLFFYDVEIVLLSKSALSDDVTTELEERQAQIRTGIGAIFASAQQSYFNEPNRETLTRQVLEYLRGVFKQDPEGHERVEAVLIPKCIGFAVD